MAEYIDRNLIEWYGCNFEEPSCKYRECSGCSYAECSHSQVMQIPTADVVERAEFEMMAERCKAMTKAFTELKIKYDDAEKRCCHAMDEKAKLRSKIDNAIGEMEIEYNNLEYVENYNRSASYGIRKSIEILKRNIEDKQNE